MAATGGMGPLYASMGVDAIGSLRTGYSQSRALKAEGTYKAGLARTNATMADITGEQTIEAGDIAASRKNLETREKSGQQLATQGASGVSVNSGSNLLVRGATDLVGRTDELTIRNNAQRAAFGYKIRAIQDRTEANMDELTAKSESNQTLLSSGLNAVEGPLSMYSNYLMYSRRSGLGGTSKIPPSYVDRTSGLPVDPSTVGDF